LYKPTDNDIREQYGIGDKTLILGVASTWAPTKGLDFIFELWGMLDSEKYAVAVIGLSDEQKTAAPEGVIALSRTNNMRELVNWFSAADMFVNPTLADNFPTVNMESIACGLPLITFKTGGSIEIFDEGSGLMVDKDDIDGMERAIRQVLKDGGLSREECILRSKKYDQNERFTEYVDLIQSML
jgi:glycosyltransferase involved in cell wall biosynthesis